MAYTFTTQRQVRRAFWLECGKLPGVTKRKIMNYAGNGKMHNTDTRCTFADYIDALSKNHMISQELAQRVTL